MLLLSVLLPLGALSHIHHRVTNIRRATFTFIFNSKIKNKDNVKIFVFLTTRKIIRVKTSVDYLNLRFRSSREWKSEIFLTVRNTFFSVSNIITVRNL